jgi:hypothetical protein
MSWLAFNLARVALRNFVMLGKLRIRFAGKLPT